ncbi:universal stress protein [Candidatus Magnetomonas plexicatena]|uniref:universal stress protein n=1 Tax=Candidatus Magnetomonas plexicatena TaxID=2552947 RepID=UPI001100C373|nr:universal stress protein [Nitrospirales bacterium LBB_01]
MECIGDIEGLLHLARQRRILVAVDNNLSSRRALSFICEMFKEIPDFTFLLYHVVDLFDDDDFVCDLETSEFIRGVVEGRLKIVEGYKSFLAQNGINEDNISVKVVLRDEPTVAECILREQKITQASTIVVGRRGISKREEFLYGSTSSKLIHLAKDCSVWVVG